MTHVYESPSQKHHILIDLGVPCYWLSIVAWDDTHSSIDEGELALMRHRRPSSLLDNGETNCVPLSLWFDEGSDERTIDLRWRARSADKSPAHVLADAIAKALAYVADKGGE